MLNDGFSGVLSNFVGTRALLTVIKSSVHKSSDQTADQHQHVHIFRIDFIGKKMLDLTFPRIVMDGTIGKFDAGIRLMNSRILRTM